MQSTLSVPDTLFTNDAATAADLVREHGRAVVKPVSYGSDPRLVTPDKIDAAREQFAAFPVQLQEYIPGTNHRVYVVNDDCVCVARIETENVSYDEGYDTVETVTLPSAVADEVVELAQQCSPGYATVDLVRSDDDWYVLEVNDGGGFAFLSEAVTNTFADVIARHLCGRS